MGSETGMVLIYIYIYIYIINDLTNIRGYNAYIVQVSMESGHIYIIIIITKSIPNPESRYATVDIVQLTY